MKFIRFQIYKSTEFVFIEMEKLNGGTLKQFIWEKGGCDEETAARIMRDIFQGLAKIHTDSYIHRDLKPDNILLEKNQEGQIVRAKIADFGLSAEFTLSNFNEVTEKMGTILYMAPE